jgi:hypothetical protein
MDIVQLNTQFLQNVRRFNMSFSNAQREADRLQDRLNNTRDVCDYSNDCGCTGYIEGAQVNLCGSCGDDIAYHASIYPPDVFRTSLETLPKPYEITIAIYSHGCDKPLPLFEGYPDEQQNIPRVQMLSAVSHGCFNYGSSESYLTMLQTVFRDKSIDQRTSFQNVKQHMNPLVRDLQRISHNLAALPSEIQYRDRFVSLPEQEIYRIHRPSTDREYDFNKNAADMAAGKEFGIYILHSSLPDDDIEFSYTNPVEPFSQRNNILSPQVSPSLQIKYSNLFFNTMGSNSITKISLQDVLYCLFRRVKWDTVRIIDLGCRATCGAYISPQPAQLRRLTSAQIVAMENQAFGKKGKSKKSKGKSKKSKGKNKKSKDKKKK